MNLAPNPKNIAEQALEKVRIDGLRLKLIKKVFSSPISW
jgi:hypothetical protein